MRRSFGKCEDRDVFLYTLENGNIRFSVCDYGATLVSLEVLPLKRDVVEGYTCVEDYMRHDTYLGASIGRTANRIEKGTFTLNGKEYHIPINNNGNANHGGIHGFDKKIFDTQVLDDEIVFTYVSEDGEEGYYMFQLHTDLKKMEFPSYPVAKQKRIPCLPTQIIPTSIWMKAKMPWNMN